MEFEPLDGGAPRVVYSNSNQILAIKSGLGVLISAVEKVKSTEEILEMIIQTYCICYNR